MANVWISLGKSKSSKNDAILLVTIKTQGHQKTQKQVQMHPVSWDRLMFWQV